MLSSVLWCVLHGAPGDITPVKSTLLGDLVTSPSASCRSAANAVEQTSDMHDMMKGAADGAEENSDTQMVAVGEGDRIADALTDYLVSSASGNTTLGYVHA